MNKMYTSPPKVTVAIALYNGEKYIKRIVNSICEQTYRNLEIILVDDGSTDRSLEVVESIASLDNRIRIIRKANEGLGATRNRCIEEASGDYLFLCDQDDILHPQLIEFCIRTAMEYKADYVALHCSVFNDSCLPQFRKFTSYSDITVKEVQNPFENLSKKADLRISLETWSYFTTMSIARSVLFNPLIKRIEGYRTVKLLSVAENVVATTNRMYFYDCGVDTSITHVAPTVNLIDDFKSALSEICNAQYRFRLKDWKIVKKEFVVRNIKYLTISNRKKR